MNRVESAREKALQPDQIADKQMSQHNNKQAGHQARSASAQCVKGAHPMAESAARNIDKRLLSRK